MIAFLCGKGRLLLSGLVCLALAAAPAARAAGLGRQTSPEELVRRLEAALKTYSDYEAAKVLAEAPENRGRAELLAVIAEHHAAGVLEYVLEERFAGVAEVQRPWKVVRIEITEKTTICEIPVLKLRIAVTAEDGSVTTREAPAYADPHGKGLGLPEGFLGLSEEDSRVTTDMNLFRAKLYDKTAGELSHEKYGSRDEALAAMADEMWRAEPTKRYMAQIVAPAVGKALGTALAKGLKEAFKEALQKATVKAAQP